MSRHPNEQLDAEDMDGAAKERRLEAGSRAATCSTILPMKVIYIASPYTLGDVAENVSVQIDAAHRILDMGHCPVAPLLSHYLHIHRQRPYQDWVTMDLALIPKMDVVLRLPGESAGADGEVLEAERHGVPVCFDWPRLEAFLSNNQLRDRS